jgi:hypothetical protein
MTAAPTMYHIAETDIAPRLISTSLWNNGVSARWLRGPGGQRRLAGQGNDAIVRGGPLLDRAASEERVIRQRLQCRIDHARPVDRALRVDMDPQVLQPAVPRPSFEHNQGPVRGRHGPAWPPTAGRPPRGCPSRRWRRRTWSATGRWSAHPPMATPPTGQIVHHGDAVHPRAFGINLAQSAAGIVQRQRPPNCHARDQRIVDRYRHRIFRRGI